MHHSKEEAKYYQQILERIIVLVTVFTVHNLPFMGSHKNLNILVMETLTLVEYLALLDA
jgi:glycogen synthase